MFHTLAHRPKSFESALPLHRTSSFVSFENRTVAFRFTPTQGVCSALASVRQLFAFIPSG